MQHNTATLEACTTPLQLIYSREAFHVQNISVAGNGAGIVGRESRLWAEYYRIICECSPRYIIIENSSQLRNKGLEIILFDLAKIGYHAQWECLRACEFGYPHTRERLFIVAYTAEVGRRQIGNVQIFREITEVLGRPYRQVILPVPIKRVHPRTNNRNVHRDYGLSKGLDRSAIAAIGDAVLVDIAEYIVKCIILFENTVYI